MKKLTFLTLALVIVLTMATSVWADDPTGEFAVIQQAADDYLSSGKSPVIKADALFENLNDGDASNDPFILSVRSPDHYAIGHIAGAINIPWREVAKPENLAKLPTDRQIVDYCYTGHTGQVAATIFNLLGYDALNLKFGIMGWTKDDTVFGHTDRFYPETQPDYRVETDPHEATTTYPYPVVSTGKAEAMDIIATAADEYLSSGKPPVIKADALFENLNDGDASNDPFVVSVRSPDHYAIGHVPGAINIPWREIAKPENLAKLPTDRQIVVYCYTGHTGQVAATILNLLGYDALNLKFGIMGWTKDDTVFGHTDRFNPATQPDYRVETAPVAVTLPTTGGALPAEAASLGLVVFGAVSLTAGVASYAWRRRNLRKAA